MKTSTSRVGRLLFISYSFLTIPSFLPKTQCGLGVLCFLGFDLAHQVCDFGLSAVKENETEKLQDTDSVPGTPLWMAPEVLMGKPFDASSDVYSFGIVLWEMLTKEEVTKLCCCGFVLLTVLQVYPEFTSFGAFKRAICYKHHRPTIPAGTEASLAALLEACWHREASQRPPFQEIIKSLELIMVDVVVRGLNEERKVSPGLLNGLPDAVGKEFWKSQLPGKERVSWDRFRDALCEEFCFVFGNVCAHSLFSLQQARFICFLLTICPLTW
jgi:hypothetical protein